MLISSNELKKSELARQELQKKLGVLEMVINSSAAISLAIEEFFRDSFHEITNKHQFNLMALETVQNVLTPASVQSFKDQIQRLT